MRHGIHRLRRLLVDRGCLCALEVVDEWHRRETAIGQAVELVREGAPPSAAARILQVDVARVYEAVSRRRKRGEAFPRFTSGPGARRRDGGVP